MIVLVGFMGAGKTAVGHLVAQKMKLPFIDTDTVIEQRAGATVGAIFEAGGEAAFRELEREVVAEVLAGPDAIVALGGGALTDPATCAALEWTTVVHLEVTYAEAMRRVADDVRRPLLSVRDPKALFDDRQEAYRRVADVTVDTTGTTVQDVAVRLLAKLAPAGADEDLRRIAVTVPSRPYEVVIGRGLVERINDLMPSLPHAEVAVLVTHPSLQALATGAVESLERCDLAVHFATLPEGESSKNLASAARLYEEFAMAGAHRHDVVVGFGGGVVTDMAGYIASTYNRGMPVVHIPTSLLAQVDAAIGGKTGVNLAEGKNLVGTIHQPVAVICDVDLLETLPQEELVSGMAEVVKYGLIADPTLLDVVIDNADVILGKDKNLLVEIVTRSVGIKAGIVAADEREQGVRGHLNYGHTFAHALEHAAGYGAMRHGEAVALGMMAGAYLAHELDRIDEDAVEVHRRALTAVGLPVSAKLDLDVLQSAWTRDKKYKGGVRFVLLSEIGQAEAGIAVPAEAIANALKRMV